MRKEFTCCGISSCISTYYILYARCFEIEGLKKTPVNMIGVATLNENVEQR